MTLQQRRIEEIHNRLMDIRDSVPWRRGTTTRDREYTKVYLHAYKTSRLREFYAAAERYRRFLAVGEITGSELQRLGTLFHMLPRATVRRAKVAE